MDRDQEEMQFLGLFGICAEACKLIFKCRIIFGQITAALILPLSIIFLAHGKVSEILFVRMMVAEDRTVTPKYNKLSNRISPEHATFILFKAAYFTSVFIFSLLSTAAVVYAVASLYTAREISFKKVMSVVPKVWKRLVVTFLFSFLAFFVYTMVFIFIIHLMDKITDAGPVISVIMLILYCTGLIYMAVIWLFASVVSVLEDSYGLKALIKSKNLIKGKMTVTAVIFSILHASYVFIYLVFELHVINPLKEGILQRIGLGVLCVLFLSKLILLTLVVQTVVYFVCQSYHHENIDKSSLSEHLEIYLGDYVPLMAKDIQLEECRV